MRTRSVLAILVLVALSAVAAAQQSGSSHTPFTGSWQLRDSSQNTLTVTYGTAQGYALDARGPNGGWKGKGYALPGAGTLIAAFLYETEKDGGFVTFTLVSDREIRFVSYNSNGVKRTEGTYMRQ